MCPVKPGVGHLPAVEFEQSAARLFAGLFLRPLLLTPAPYSAGCGADGGASAGRCRGLKINSALLLGRTITFRFVLPLQIGTLLVLSGKQTSPSSLPATSRRIESAPFR